VIDDDVCGESIEDDDDRAVDRLVGDSYLLEDGYRCRIRRTAKRARATESTAPPRQRLHVDVTGLRERPDGLSRRLLLIDESRPGKWCMSPVDSPSWSLLRSLLGKSV